MKMNYLEEFLFSAQDKIDGLRVYTEPYNREDYRFLVIEFENQVNKIEKNFVINFCNIYQKLNKDQTEVVEVKPFKNLGQVKQIGLRVDSQILNNEDVVSELLEKIVSKIYEKYNFLILPPTDENIEAIDPSEYVYGPYDIVGTQTNATQEKLYSIAFKVRAEANNETEYLPLKLYFRLKPKPDGKYQIEMADEFNNISKSNTNILTARKFTKEHKRILKNMFDNKEELNKDKQMISDNINFIINGVLMKIANYVDDFDNSPNWFQSSELGKYIQKVSLSGSDQSVQSTASFRYITQTPLPYSYLTVRMKNKFGVMNYEIKKSSSDNQEINESINTCPMCGEAINASNRLVTSDQYREAFIGCQKCMTTECSQCTAKWNNSKPPKTINSLIKGTFYYKVGECNSPFCNVGGAGMESMDCYGSRLCLSHSRRCVDPGCIDIIYCEKVVESCSNTQCNNTYCKEHAPIRLYKCEASGCRNSQYINQYCDECKDIYLNTCKFCGNTMCQSCSSPVLTLNSRGKFERSENEFICSDCFESMNKSENKDINIKNKALIKDSETGKYLPKSMEYLFPYGDYKGQFIDKEIAERGFKSFKPEGWQNDENLGRYYYRSEDMRRCDYCREFFHITKASTENRNSHYCEDCLKECNMCHSYSVIDTVFSADNQYFCKGCHNKHWDFSDLSMDNEPINIAKAKLIEEVFTNNSLAKQYKVFPVGIKDLFVCPESLLKISSTQVKTCKNCGEVYSVTLFNEDSSTCNICEQMNHLNPKENEILVKAFYNPTFGPKNEFKAYATKNTLLIKYLSGNEYKYSVYHLNTKSGKYVLGNKKEVR